MSLRGRLQGIRAQWREEHIDLDRRTCLVSVRSSVDRAVVGYALCHEVQGQDERCQGLFHTDPSVSPAPPWTRHGSIRWGTISFDQPVVCVRHMVGGHIRRGRWHELYGDHRADP